MYSLNYLIRNSLRINPSTIEVMPNGGEVTVGDLAPYNGHYAIKNKVIAWVNNGVSYVTPFTTRALLTLWAIGSVEGNFYVPFSKGFPKNDTMRWETLVANAVNSDEEKFARKCEQYSDEHGIASLTEKTLRKFFILPEEIRVANVNYTATLKPLLSSRQSNATRKLALIGHYNTNNGVVCLVYRDGRTILHPGYEIIPELERAGFHQMEFIFPLSSGETIMNGGWLRRWTELKSM